MTRLIWEKRASAAAGKRGLKMEPSGAMTSIGRNDPWFDGTLISEVSASRRRERIAQKHATLVEPSKGTLKPVSTWSAEPVRSTSMPSPLIRTHTLMGRRTSRFRPSSSRNPSARYSPSGIAAIRWRRTRSV